MPHEPTVRETFSSIWGTAFAFLGVAVGLGNFWRFPYMMGIFGGGAFLLVYLTIVIAVGVPTMIAEMALGRHTRRGPIGALVRAGLPGGRSMGRLMVFGVAMATSYYLVVLGWILAFAVLSLAAIIGRVELSAETFGILQRNPALQVACSGVVASAAAIVVSRGIRAGVERVSRWFIPAFAAMTLILITRSLTLPGAWDGLVYLFDPDFSALTPRAIMAAVGQAFFSLGLGGTFLVIYGSYLPGRSTLPRRALVTVSGDVVASMLAALAVIPLVFAHGLSLTEGPPLIFEVLPEAFAALPGGAVFSFIFFSGLGCVAFLSGVAAIEVLVGSLRDERGIARRRTVWWIAGALVAIGYPATVSVEYLMWSDLVWGSTLQPAGSVAAVVAVSWALGHGPALRQLGVAGPVPRWGTLWFYWLRYVVPFGVSAALIAGWIV
jgi:NSS family neurotransmitter:Na+ symporter